MLEKTRRKILMLIIICLCALNVNGQQRDNRAVEDSILKYHGDLWTQEDSILKYHFNLLDSVVKKHPKDTIFYCCPGSSFVFEGASGIAATSPGTYLGRSYFTKSTFIKWRAWYLNRHKVKKAD